MRVSQPQLVDVAVAVVNAPITAITALMNLATGAKLRRDRHYTVVCEGGLLSDLGLSSAFTTGNTINVKAAAALRLRDDEKLLDHEWRHSVQWALLGPVWFLPLYALSYFGSQAFAGNQSWNVFEWTAGFADGGYDDCLTIGKSAERAPAEKADKTVR